MEENGKLLMKYVPPTALCKEPYGTKWMHIINDDEADIYIQSSLDENAPDWKKLSLFLESIFSHLFDDNEFIDECLKLYKSISTDEIPRGMAKLSIIIKKSAK